MSVATLTPPTQALNLPTHRDPYYAGKWQKPAGVGITLFESHGLALWDLAAGSVVLEAAREHGLGEEVQLFS